ncbi:hypothetical protein BGZ58_003281, partial [Dissophora ornata]
MATEDDIIFRLCEDFDPSLYDIESEDIAKFKNKHAKDNKLSTAPEANIQEFVKYWKERGASIYKIDTRKDSSEDEAGNEGEVARAQEQEKDDKRACLQNQTGRQKNKKKKNRRKSQQQGQRKSKDQRPQGEGPSTFTTAPPDNDIQASNSISELVESLDKEPQSTQRQHLKSMEIHALLENLEKFKNENSHLRQLLKRLEKDRDDDEQRQYGIEEQSNEELKHIKTELHAAKKELWELRKRDSSQGAILAETMFNCEKNATDLASARKIIEDLKEQNSNLRRKYDQQAGELGKNGQDMQDVTRRLSLTETQLKR